VLAGLMLAVAVTAPRFFFAGDGHLVLQHAHFNTTLDTRYRHADGSYDPAALAQIRHFFRSREDGREADISLRLIELLAYIQGRYHPRQMILLSGFRSPEFNADLRSAGQQVAQASLHTQGLAADVTFTGIDLVRLWRQLRELHTGGAGYYRKGHFLHIDTGPPRFWEETTSRVSENLAADNARVFLRTDFDRYTQMEGAILSLHSVTAFPLLISPHPTVVGPAGSATMTIQPVNGTAPAQGNGCFAITTPQDAYQFRVVTAGSAAQALKTTPNARSHVVMSTCEPRIGKTASEIESNPIEGLGR
jgi:uncharacterized protein YcbK (DUF882 family)